MKSKYSQELKEWLIENYRGTSDEVLDKIKKEFNIELTRKQLYKIIYELRKKGYNVGKLLPPRDFRKGMPTWRMLNESPAGTIRKRKKGNFIKMEDGRWEYYHRYVYEQHYGKIPRGYIIHHINGNIFDDRIENLIKVSRPIHNYLISQGLWFNDRENVMTACLLAELAHRKPHRIRKKKNKNVREKLFIQPICN